MNITLEPKALSKIRDISLPNKLKNFSDICKKYDLLSIPEVHERIYKVAEIRNRIHIQNQEKSAPPYERALWTKDLVQMCENLLKDIYIFMCEHHRRPEHIIALSKRLDDTF
ncbi:hypothetical protein [Candidatus Fokinia solitaria]|nr:hypothetical protein [Candidatus Fokinia solitaria]